MTTEEIEMRLARIELIAGILARASGAWAPDGDTLERMWGDTAAEIRALFPESRVQR